MKAVSTPRENSSVQSILEEIRCSCSYPSRHLPIQVQEILKQIHRDPFDPSLRVTTLKKRCRIRNNNISSRFRTLTGTTIPRYVQRLRMKAAAKLLRRTDLPVFDIALSVGYEHPQTFYRVFQRTYSMTPVQYRSTSDSRAS